MAVQLGPKTDDPHIFSPDEQEPGDLSDAVLDRTECPGKSKAPPAVTLPETKVRQSAAGTGPHGTALTRAASICDMAIERQDELGPRQQGDRGVGE